MIALTPPLLTAVLMGYAANNAVAIRASEPAHPSLKDRCAIARIVAAEVVDELAFRRWGFPYDNRLLLFISESKIEKKLETSIFGKNETCGEIEVGSRYFPERRVKVTLGRGKENDLPSNQLFHLVRIQPSSARRWEIAWNTGKYAWTCPKPWEREPHVPQICIGPDSGLVASRTLRISVVKSATGEFTVASSRLEFLRSPRHKPYPGNSDKLSNLSLPLRCEIAYEVSNWVVTAVAYSRWCGLFGKNLTVAIPASAENDPNAAPTSILRPGERCEELRRIDNFYALGSVAVNIATNGESSLAPSREFISVRTRELAAGHWEFSWTFDKGLWTCPKPEEEHYLGECPDPVVASIRMPTARLEMVRESLNDVWKVVRELEFKADDDATPQAATK
jgi:hypothetical protein